MRGELLLRSLTDPGSEVSTFPSTQRDKLLCGPSKVLGGAGAPGQVGEDVNAPTRKPPSTLLAPLPSARVGGFYHIKMFGLMGLTRPRGGMKKGPLFSRLCGAR